MKKIKKTRKYRKKRIRGGVNTVKRKLSSYEDKHPQPPTKKISTPRSNPVTKLTKITQQNIIMKQPELLGQGAYGTVLKIADTKNTRRGPYKTIKEYAVKKTNIQSNSSEIDILQKLNNNPYVVQLVTNNFENKKSISMELLSNPPYMELFDYMTLHNVRNNSDLTDTQLIQIVGNLCDGIQSIHQAHIYHRDIKPENIMININTLDIKYVDFGVSCFENTLGRCSNKITGTILYIDPLLYTYTNPVLSEEQLKGCDLWSLGVVICQLETGKFPIEICYYNSEININTDMINNLLKSVIYDIHSSLLPENTGNTTRFSLQLPIEQTEINTIIGGNTNTMEFIKRINYDMIHKTFENNKNLYLIAKNSNPPKQYALIEKLFSTNLQIRNQSFSK